MNAKKALLPIAGAKAKGKLVYNPINNENIAERIAVTTVTAPTSIPAAPIKDGCTTKM